MTVVCHYNINRSIRKQRHRAQKGEQMHSLIESFEFRGNSETLLTFITRFGNKNITALKIHTEVTGRIKIASEELLKKNMRPAAVSTLATSMYYRTCINKHNTCIVCGNLISAARKAANFLESCCSDGCSSFANKHEETFNFAGTNFLCLMRTIKAQIRDLGSVYPPEIRGFAKSPVRIIGISSSIRSAEHVNQESPILFMAEDGTRRMCLKLKYFARSGVNLIDFIKQSFPPEELIFS